MIADRPAFEAAVAKAAALARDGWLVTFGIEPTGPETGYGYIRRGEAVGDLRDRHEPRARAHRAGRAPLPEMAAFAELEQ